MRKNMNTAPADHTSKRRWLVPTTLVAALALAGCGDRVVGEKHPLGPDESSTPSASAQGATHAVAPAIRFDRRDGGSSTILVYPGPTTSPEDMQYNGTFTAGDVRPASCQEQGREVHTHPEAGERDLRSSTWYRLAGGPPVYWATGAYADPLPGALIPPC